MTYAIDETGELKLVDLDEVTAQGAALVIRAGGGRVGESFALSGGPPEASAGRPDADIFLDDVTVSRDHALLIRRAYGYHLDDMRLAGTAPTSTGGGWSPVRLDDGDELQIGKYKLSFLTR